MWMRAAVVAAVLMAGLPVQGCSSPSDAGPKLEVGAWCGANADCPGGFCLERSCSKHCSADADCAEYGGLACGVDASGERSCVPQCGSFGSHYACIAGVATSCEVASDQYCEDCGCPSTQRCEPDQGCMPKRPVGEPCKTDDDCNTDNCSSFAGVCRAPIGAACDSTSCDVCLVADGWSYCSRECSGNSECGSGLCLGNADTFYCRPPCSSFSDASCPGSKCDVFIDDLSHRTSYYCDCVDSQTCKWTASAHPLGQECRYDSDCEGNLCDRVGTKIDPFYGRLFEGMCSQPCATTAECGAGFACAMVGSPHCLPTCTDPDTDTCAIGDCVGLPTAEGASANLCWIKRAGGECVEPTDCQSGNCVSGSCAPAGGQANGAACDTGEDCVSKSCIAGQCRGKAVLGEACSAPADCAVGTCCSSGALINTCASKCE
jgi:hypothetical protein